MEIFLFFLDILAVIILVVTSLRNDLKRPGEPLEGPFRYDVSPSPAGGAGEPLTDPRHRNRH